MLIGILQTGHVPEQLAPESGDYADMFERMLAGHGFRYRVWQVVDGEPLPEVDAADGWLISGSRHGAYEDHPWIKPLEAFIRAAYGAHVPVVGICFGHQIIAQAMGGKVEKFARGWSVGATRYDFDGQQLVLNAWHQDQVVERPESARVLAHNDFCENAALLYDDRMLTIQAHPEFQPAFIDGLIRTRGKNVVPDPLLAVASANLDQPLDNPALGNRIAAFFKAAGAATQNKG